MLADENMKRNSTAKSERGRGGRRDVREKKDPETEEWQQ
jgi:hypothetical protein